MEHDFNFNSSLKSSRRRNSSSFPVRTESATSTPSMNPYEHLHISLNPDGTLTRHQDLPETSPTPVDPTNSIPVLSKDITLDNSKNTWARIFVPRRVLVSSTSHGAPKLPLAVYYHGGGFILLSPSSSIFHDWCVNMADSLGVVIVSVKYRLAPEHRLPAAYEDGMEALHWIKTAQDDWLKNYADLSNCFLMGTSAGANIAYHVGFQATNEMQELQPLNIRGLILHQQYFGGSERSGSELRLINDQFIPLCVNDLMWELSLPVGADRDHEYSNPTMGSVSEILLEKMKLYGWRVMIFGCRGDPLVDRQTELAKWMEKKGVKVVSHFLEGGSHVYGAVDEEARALQNLTKDFMQSTLGSP